MPLSRTQSKDYAGEKHCAAENLTKPVRHFQHSRLMSKRELARESGGAGLLSGGHSHGRSSDGRGASKSNFSISIWLICGRRFGTIFPKPYRMRSPQLVCSRRAREARPFHSAIVRS